MATFERRILGARRIWQIASEKSLDEMYRCVFGWAEADADADADAPQVPHREDLEDEPPAGVP
jgi:hypothetical protein